MITCLHTDTGPIFNAVGYYENIDPAERRIFDDAILTFGVRLEDQPIYGGYITDLSTWYHLGESADPDAETLYKKTDTDKSIIIQKLNRIKEKEDGKTYAYGVFFKVLVDCALYNVLKNPYTARNTQKFQNYDVTEYPDLYLCPRIIDFTDGDDDDIVTLNHIITFDVLSKSSYQRYYISTPTTGGEK